MKTNKILVWFRSQKGWVLNNLAWSAIACGTGLVLALIAHFIPLDLIQLWVTRSADNLQPLGTLQALACALKTTLYMSTLACIGVTAYTNVCWISTFFLDACGLREKRS